jgi:Do/DeqQ family serine protease
MNTNMHSIAKGVLTATLGGIISIGIYKAIEPKETQTFNPIEHTPVQLANFSSAEITVDFVKVAEMTVPAVVHVKTKTQGETQYYYDPFKEFFGGGGYYKSRPQLRLGSGSGVIISEDGYIITNNHVIAEADEIEVILNDRRSFSATIVGSDPSTDLALIKISEIGLPYIPFGNSDIVKVGEWVLAVGNPFNLTSTVTAGIISAKGRNINILNENNAIEAYIQTDAAVNPGNSGGALVNTSGELIGVNSAIASNTGSYTGYSFAVPSNIAKKVAADLMEYGQVQRAYMGVSIRDIDAELARELKTDDLKGIYISSVSENGAAKDAGMKEGDIITKIGAITVNDVPELQEQLSKFRPGDKTNITIKSDGEEKVIEVIFKNLNGETQLNEKEEAVINNILGASFEEITNQEKQDLGINNGIKVARLIGGRLRNAGLKEGFIITHIDRKVVITANDIMSALENKKGGVLIEGIYPNGMKAYYGFGL